MAMNSYGLPDDDGDEPSASTGMVQMPDDGGGAVTPQSATPSMAKGGAIPDEDEELGSNAGVEDKTTTQLNGALQKVQQALMFGRQQSGLPGGGGSSGETQPQEEQMGVPEDDGDQSYAKGGVIGDDIEASNNATDDGPQYGRPETVDDPEAVRPPISSNNTNYGDVPEQTAIPQEQAAAPGGDESGAMPATPPVNDESGAAPTVAGGIPTDDYTQPAVDAMGNSQPGSGPQSIIGYLQGKGAMDNEQAIALERSVTPQANNNPAAVPVLATAAAGTPEQQFAYIQRNRLIYDTAMNHGRAALNGVEGRPPSLDVAIADATKAFANVPDGENVHFVKHGDGVVAQVSGDSGREQRGYPLTLQQFDQLLDTGKDGMFDRMMAPGGARRVLGSFQAQQEQQPDGASTNPYLQRATERISAGAGAQQQQQQPKQQPRLNDADANRANQTERSINMGHDVTLLRSPVYDQQNPEEARANQAGRGGSLGLSGKPVRVMSGANGDNDKVYNNGLDVTPDKNQLNALERIRAKNEGKLTADDRLDIEDRKTEGRQKVEETRGKNRLDAVDARGKYYTQHEDRLDARSEANRGSREKMAANKLVESAKAREAANGRNAASNAERMAASRVLAGKETPEDKAIVDRIYKASQQQQAPQQQRPSADQQALLWANANPNDPRAARIKQLHGVQ